MGYIMGLLSGVKRFLFRAESNGARGNEPDPTAQRVCGEAPSSRKLTAEEREGIHHDIANDPRVDEALEGALTAFPQFRKKASGEGGVPRSHPSKRQPGH